MIAIICQILYCLFCIGLAYIDYKKISQGKRINHFWNGLIHLTAAALCFFFFGWNISVALLLFARVFFDVSLNNFRGLALDYVSPNPKSIVDIWEKKIFGNDGLFPKILYLAIGVILQFL